MTGVATRMHVFTIPSRGNARGTTCPQIGGGVLVLAKPVCWHEQGVTRDLDTYDGALRYEKLWYLFYRYLCVSPGTTRKCILHDSVRYHNIRSRDPITLLSMDFVVETFLEIGVSDLLVLT